MSDRKPHTPTPADEVWAILREVAEGQKETRLQMQETDRRMRQTDRGGRRGPGEVLRPGEPRRADGAGGAQGEGQAGAEAGEAIPGGRGHGRRLGVTDDRRDAAGRSVHPANDLANFSGRRAERPHRE